MIHHPRLSEHIFEEKVKRALRKAEKNPTDPIMQFEAQKLSTQFGYAFQLEKGDQSMSEDVSIALNYYSQAYQSFQSGIKLGKNALLIYYPNFEEWLINPEETRIQFSLDHIPNLYWTAVNIGGLIKAGKGSPHTLVLFPQIGLLFHTALRLNPNWENGSIYSALISYTMAEFPVSDAKKKKVKVYFEKAIELSKGLDASPYLAYAESVSVKNQDKIEFESLLNSALSIPQIDDEYKNLQNLIAKKRARWLLSRIDDLFY